MAANTDRPRPPPNRRRDKAQLSCNPCRHRKLRCDRQQPCGACSRRGVTSSCNYVTVSAPMLTSGPAIASRRSTSLQGRISELESLVVGLMNGRLAPSQPRTISSELGPPSTVDILPEATEQTETAVDPGTLKSNDSGITYVQAEHWEAILASIRGLQEDSMADDKSRPGSCLFYGTHRHATRGEILAAVPPRSVVDRLLAIHFDSYIVTPYLLHRKKFLREYENFWKDPSTTSIAWIGLMFSMLSIAAQLQIFSFDDSNVPVDSKKNEYHTMKDACREKALQCMVLAGYTTGGPYILETLITILTGEFVLSKDIGNDGRLFISIIFHIAMRMGYHRDPEHFSSISTFEAEIRRRIWVAILQLDLGLSLEMGLPRTATDTQIDTKEPRNLLDSDFDEDITQLPLSRPETEWTPILPLIARGRLVSALGLICDVNANANPPSHDEIHKIDALLEDLRRHAVPSVLRWEGSSHPITDSPNLIVQRISTVTTIHKARILLHRRALIKARNSSISDRDQVSIRICMQSALKILSFQEMLHEESRPLGRLSQLRWKVNHIMHQDVLLATSILCLCVQDANKLGLSEAEIEDIRQNLAMSHKIWSQMSSTSAEADKVAKVLDVVLGKATSSVRNAEMTGSLEAQTNFNAMPWDDFGEMLNDQYLPSGFFSPSAFFDSLLETGDT